LILHGGDFVEAGTFAELSALGPLEAVHGNMDDDELRLLLPRRRVVEVGEARIGMTHDSGQAGGRAERLAGWFDDCDAVVYGHTHQPEVTRHGDVWILNPGSPTERRRASAHTMLLLDVAGRTISPELVDLT
jgi:putative phosphoesterase